jgi:hypothetical protein
MTETTYCCPYSQVAELRRTRCQPVSQPTISFCASTSARKSSCASSLLQSHQIQASILVSLASADVIFTLVTMRQLLLCVRQSSGHYSCSSFPGVQGSITASSSTHQSSPNTSSFSIMRCAQGVHSRGGGPLAWPKKEYCLAHCSIIGKHRQSCLLIEASTFTRVPASGILHQRVKEGVYIHCLADLPHSEA